MTHLGYFFLSELHLIRIQLNAFQLAAAEHLFSPVSLDSKTRMLSAALVNLSVPNEFATEILPEAETTQTAFEASDIFPKVLQTWLPDRWVHLVGYATNRLWHLTRETL